LSEPTSIPSSSPTTSFPSRTPSTSRPTDVPVTSQPTPNAKCVYIRNPDAVIIDVRTEGEWDEGHVECAHNIDYSGGDFTESAVEAVTGSELDTLVVLYCRTGTRAGFAQLQMESWGYTNVVNLGGWTDIADCECPPAEPTNDPTALSPNPTSSPTTAPSPAPTDLSANPTPNPVTGEPTYEPSALSKSPTTYPVVAPTSVIDCMTLDEVEAQIQCLQNRINDLESQCVAAASDATTFCQATLNDVSSIVESA